MAKSKNDIVLDDILHWIFSHRVDQDAMDQISTLAYPFSTKYKNRFAASQDPEVSY